MGCLIFVLSCDISRQEGNAHACRDCASAQEAAVRPHSRRRLAPSWRDAPGQAHGHGFAGPPLLPHVLPGTRLPALLRRPGARLRSRPTAARLIRPGGRAAWGVGGSPPPWQKGRPGVGAVKVSSIFWFTMVVLVFKRELLTGERLSLAVRRASARYAGRSAPAARGKPGV
jgi:hypothetical protein